ncbi:unnamed protein product [Brassica oleracea]
MSISELQECIPSRHRWFSSEVRSDGSGLLSYSFTTHQKGE